MENDEIPTLEERVQKAREDADIMDKRNKTGLSFVDIIKPVFWLHTLLWIKQQSENGK